MKYFLICAVLLLSLGACNDRMSEGKKLAAEIQSVQSALRPGTFPTTEGGWTMTAKLNGVNWIATSMFPPEASSRIIGYYKNDYIGFPYDRRNMVVGKKMTFREDNAADLAVDDEIGLYGGRKGEMEITKVDGNWAEGKFYFTANTVRNSSKTVEVTDGFFRISIK
ncbi:MAG TPA: hypothetical protein VE035_11795 [Puia sp.]|nr:hypothetical protein [Puia sp.]